MLSSSKYPSRASWLHNGELSDYAQAYWDLLTTRQYAQHTKDQYMLSVSHFTRWVDLTNIRLCDYTKADVAKFISAHIPNCKCEGPMGITPHIIRAAMKHLLTMLKDLGLLKEKAYNPIDEELQLYDIYMRDARGLAPNTRIQRLQIVRWYLTETVNSETGLSTALSANGLRSFISRKMKSWSPQSAGTLAGSLRGYIKYKTFCGNESNHLLPVILSPANWKLAQLPETLTSSEITQMLNSFPLDMPATHRAYAMVRCVVDLGLRSSEVIGINLEDINWSAGTIRIGNNKSRRTHILPMPNDTGKALAIYLRSERPTTMSRRLFVRHAAPVDKAIGPGVVRSAVRGAYLRCGISQTRVHVLRNTLASRILEGGGTLKEIADVLRHRDLNTAMIYTKVDDSRLSEIGLQWPGLSA